MSLEQSMEKLAAAMTRYADVIEKYAVEIKSAVSGKAAAAAPAAADADEEKKPDPKADKKPAGRPKGSTKAKPEPEPEEDDDDGMGEDEDEDEESELTREDVKNKLKEVIEATDDRKAASAIFKNLGYASVADIAEKDFQKVYDLAVKAIKKAG